MSPAGNNRKDESARLVECVACARGFQAIDSDLSNRQGVGAKVRILLAMTTGTSRPAIAVLAEALSDLASVTVVAPERDRSGASNSLNLDRPLSVRTSRTASDS